LKVIYNSDLRFQVFSVSNRRANVGHGKFCFGTNAGFRHTTTSFRHRKCNDWARQAAANLNPDTHYAPNHFADYREISIVDALSTKRALKVAGQNGRLSLGQWQKMIYITCSLRVGTRCPRRLIGCAITAEIKTLA
jgi:hypothetical protein